MKLRFQSTDPNNTRIEDSAKKCAETVKYGGAKCNKKSNSQILQDFALQTTKNESQGSKIQKQSKQILKTALVFVKRLLRKVV